VMKRRVVYRSASPLQSRTVRRHRL
jgi:hypothetical protein